MELRWKPVDKSDGIPPAHAVQVNTCWCVLQVRTANVVRMGHTNKWNDWEDIPIHIKGDYAEEIKGIKYSGKRINNPRPKWVSD